MAHEDELVGEKNERIGSWIYDMVNTDQYGHQRCIGLVVGLSKQHIDVLFYGDEGNTRYERKYWDTSAYRVYEPKQEEVAAFLLWRMKI